VPKLHLTCRYGRDLTEGPFDLFTKELKAQFTARHLARSQKDILNSLVGCKAKSQAFRYPYHSRLWKAAIFPAPLIRSLRQQPITDIRIFTSRYPQGCSYYKIHAHIQSSTAPALTNATMNILQNNVNATYLATTNQSSMDLHMSDSAIAIALPYSSGDPSTSVTSRYYAASTFLTRHPQYINVCFLVLLLIWAFWEKIVQVYQAFDDWLVDETMKEDHRVFMENYWRSRREMKVVGILKPGSVDGAGVEWTGCRKEIEENCLLREGRRKRVTFGKNVLEKQGMRS
jgi:hypothetical protein